MKRMITTALFLFAPLLTSAFSIEVFGNEETFEEKIKCPDLRGVFSCPEFKSSTHHQPAFIFYVDQSDIPNGVAYSRFYAFPENPVIETNIASPKPWDDSVSECMKDKKLGLIGSNSCFTSGGKKRCTFNTIGKNKNYQAYVEGKLVIECERVKKRN